MQTTGIFPIVKPEGFGHFPEPMSDIEDHLAQQIETRLKELGESAYSFEQKMGWPADALRSILRKDSKRARPNLERIKTVCDALGLEVYIGPPRAPAPSGIDVRSTLDEHVKIPVYDAFLSAGNGFNNPDHGSDDFMIFKKDQLRKLGVPPSAAVLAKVSGKSMLPTIHPGDMILIDTSKREIPKRPKNYKSKPAPIYAFVTDDGARVKRVSQLEDILLLVSDNPDVGMEMVKREEWDRINVIGEVVWWSHANRA